MKESLDAIEDAPQDYAAEYRAGAAALEQWRELRRALRAKLSNHNLLVLEAHLRILRSSSAEAAAVTLDELEELLRVYRLLTEPPP